MKKTNFFLVLAIALMALTQSVWAIDPHFYLIGSFTGNNWSGDAQKNFPINVNYESGKSKYCIEVDVVKDSTYFFALFNGDNRYAPLGDKNGENSYGQNKVLDATKLATYPGEAVCASQGKKADAWYNSEVNNQYVGDNSWQITANFTGKLLICLDEDYDQEWYPYVWLERPRYYLMGEVLSGENTWGANNLSLPLVDKYDENGKYYANLYLKKDTYFALSRGGKRFAPESSMDITINDENGQPKTYAGSCGNGQDNSWKYVGESGLVRLVLDVENKTFTLEPWQMYLIGSAANGDQWNVANTSTPLNVAYFNLDEDTYEEGKYYHEVWLNQNDGFLAFSDGIHRYANNTTEENKDINVGDEGQQGTYDKANNSWKYVGESGTVRVCIDYTTAHKPYIWLEKWYKIRTGAIVGHDYGKVHVSCKKGDPLAKDSTFRKGSDLQFTTTPDAGFYHAGWSWNQEGTSVAGPWDGIFRSQTEDARVYAKFLPRYDVLGSLNKEGDPQGGMPGWTASEANISDYQIAVNDSTYSKTYVLMADTTYKFKLYDNNVKSYVGMDGESAVTVNLGQENTFSTGIGKDVLFTTSQAGKYTFKIVYSAINPAKVTVSYDGAATLVDQTSVVNDNIVYDIMGRAWGTSLENLPQGIYVRNGKKFVVAQ